MMQDNSPKTLLSEFIRVLPLILLFAGLIAAWQDLKHDTRDNREAITEIRATQRTDHDNLTRIATIVDRADKQGLLGKKKETESLALVQGASLERSTLSPQIVPTPTVSLTSTQIGGQSAQPTQPAQSAQSQPVIQQSQTQTSPQQVASTPVPQPTERPGLVGGILDVVTGLL